MNILRNFKKEPFGTKKDWAIIVIAIIGIVSLARSGANGSQILGYTIDAIIIVGLIIGIGMLVMKLKARR